MSHIAEVIESFIQRLPAPTRLLVKSVKVEPQHPAVMGRAALSYCCFFKVFTKLNAVQLFESLREIGPAGMTIDVSLVTTAEEHNVFDVIINI